MFYFIVARAEGVEPPSTVLETAILPLNYARMLKKTSSDFVGTGHTL
jgi:hypothetical protein